MIYVYTYNNFKISLLVFMPNNCQTSLQIMLLPIQIKRNTRKISKMFGICSRYLSMNSLLYLSHGPLRSLTSQLVFCARLYAKQACKKRGAWGGGCTSTVCCCLQVQKLRLLGFWNLYIWFYHNVDYEYDPFFLRDSRASETRARVKIISRALKFFSQEL